MVEAHLYTIILDVYETQEVFIDQLRTTATHLDHILSAWVEQAVARGFIKSKEGPQQVLHDIMDDDNTFLQLGQNIWDISFLIGKGMYTYSACESYYDERLNKYVYEPALVLCTLNFILTPEDTTPSVSKNVSGSFSISMKRLLRTAEVNYASCQLEHTRFKGSASLDKAFNQRRKQLEKRLLNWSTKINFLRQGYNRDEKSSYKSVYTTIFYYVYHRSKDAEKRILQLAPIVGHDISYVFHSWATKIMYARWDPSQGQQMGEQMLNNQDRRLLMGKISSGYYVPVPVEDCVNVWGTYFSLSEGMVKLTIIKTALDEVVQA